MIKRCGPIKKIPTDKMTFFFSLYYFIESKTAVQTTKESSCISQPAGQCQPILPSVDVQQSVYATTLITNPDIST